MLGLKKVAKNHFGRKRFTKLAAWLAKAKARSAPDSFFPASPRCAQPEKKQASMQTIRLWRGVEIVARTTRLTINHPSEQLDRRCSQAFSDPPIRRSASLWAWALLQLASMALLPGVTARRTLLVAPPSTGWRGRGIWRLV